MLEFLRKLLPYTAILCGIAALYVAWTFYSRWNANRELRDRADAKTIEARKQTTDLLAGGKLKILNFYASEGRLCYGVVNAKSVKIEPGVERVWPSLAHCVDIAPKKVTAYTLTAEDAEGHTVSESVTVQVR